MSGTEPDKDEGAPNDEVLTDGNVGADADLSTDNGKEADSQALNDENATNAE
jgi:hypothetical protein